MLGVLPRSVLIASDIVAGLSISDDKYDEYKAWRLAQIGRGERMEDLSAMLAQRFTTANEAAIAYIDGSTAEIYALNRNWAVYTIERVSDAVDFNLWDEHTVKNLLVNNPDLMPYYPPEKALDRGIDLAWGKQKITQITTSGILQGKSIDSMAKYLTDTITGMEKASAIRAARTATTAAENAGRMDSYDEANRRGLDIQKQWMATLDSRTRHTHGALDGVHIPNNKTFDNGCRYPADPRGDASEVYNCRCTLVAWFPELEGENKTRWARGDDGKGTTVKNQTFTEWQNEKIQVENKKKNDIIESTKQAFIEQLKNGEIKTYLSVQKQNRHVKNSKAFMDYDKKLAENGEHPSYISENISANKLYDKIKPLLGTGEIDIKPDGSFQEFIKLDETIGFWFDKNSNQYQPTNVVQIKYAVKKGNIHIVPVNNIKG